MCNKKIGYPKKQGLYDPAYEHDACGVGFVCNINGERSYDIIDKAIQVLVHMSHRGSVGADPLTGDGAGLLLQIPDKFYRELLSENNNKLPLAGKYGTGILFLPADAVELEFCKKEIEKIIAEEEQFFVQWRVVPVNDSVIGRTAKETQPMILQVFIEANSSLKDQMAFERKLYVIRKRAENLILNSKIKNKQSFYINSLSSRTIVYKGLLTPEQVKPYYMDLQDNRMESALALVHSRYSTNTFPTWDLAQPFRFLAHNGEINTLRGNINWMHAREKHLAHEVFGDDIDKIKPIVCEGKSDSATLDNVFELLCLTGRSLFHSMRMLVPSAWEKDVNMSEKLRDFYKFHACFTEPWDGPSAVAFTDGKNIGAVLDRNGLRPARYIKTRSGFVVMASEIGVLDIPASDIECSGRLEPGKMFFIDTEKGKIVEDNSIKEQISSQQPYSKWVKENMLELYDVKPPKAKNEDMENIIIELKAFGYSREDLKLIIKPMAFDALEPIGSMGVDYPHACLSSHPQIMFNYFKQLFAQVTNPAIDPIREEIVMSLDSYIGTMSNLLKETPQHSRKIHINHPILTNQALNKIKSIDQNGFKTKTISILFEKDDKNGFEKVLENICIESEKAVQEGFSFILLTDRGANEQFVSLPVILATGAVQHHLVRKMLRTKLSIIVESAEVREVHHFAVLFGYGVDCVNPYLAYKAIQFLINDGSLNLSYEDATANYIKACEKGILKILSKIGISTLRSYKGAQIFEILGIADDVVNKYFTGTASRIGGVSLDGLKQETLKRHSMAYSEFAKQDPNLSSGGIYQYKRDGEYHLWNPDTISALQDSVRNENYNKYKEFSRLINDQASHPTTLRSLFKIKKSPIDIEKVEPVEKILKRFCTGAMSFGSISRGAHESLAIAMNRIGGRSNTGEGGEDPARFTPMANGDSTRSSIKQVASGRFGVNTNYLMNCDEIQIKIAQGAKPGEGGQLPGHKVSSTIARIRYTTAGVTLISPPPHHDIYSIEDLAQLIFDLKNVNPRARISVKLVSEVGVGTIAAGVSKAHADMILISGADGGTGASPKSSIRHTGLPWELGLSETHQTLVLNDLRTRVKLQADGQMRTGRDVIMAALLGADEYGFCTAALITVGCVMLRHCHLNNCSVGVATQDELLEKRFQGKPEYVVNYMKFVAQEVREILAEIGCKTIEEAIGRTDLIEINSELIPEKAKGLDFSKILYKPKQTKTTWLHKGFSSDIIVEEVLDRQLIEKAKDAIHSNQVVNIDSPIRNFNRTTGAMLSGEVCKYHGDSGLSEDSIVCNFKGIAGQSFGAWLAKGVTFKLEGLANDYVGKGISGGKIIIYPEKNSGFSNGRNVIVGNTTFYGAISGEAYIRGVAGERFCIRNSGLYAVIEGVGDHGCEYMTGGRVVILGETGRNFAAGMSGGIAYIYDPNKTFLSRCNMEMVEFDQIQEQDKKDIHYLLQNQFRYTQSIKAALIINDFQNSLKDFIKVMPTEYKRVLETMKQTEDALNCSEVSDG
ncbi:MAG: glutamate synthase large subunit [Candidatus Omnitrophica bacterium]|nr:glutamate synthase large subunit [Candidatus Omnitrophota bacterium]